MQKLLSDKEADDRNSSIGIDQGEDENKTSNSEIFGESPEDQTSP